MGLQQKAKQILEQDEIKKKISAQDKFFLRQRQEMLVNLLELGRALVNSRSEKQFWQTLVSAVTAQTGSRQIAVFFREDDRIVLKNSQGFHFDPDFRFPAGSTLITLVQEKKEPVSFSDIQNQLQGREFVWLKSLQPQLIVPLYQREENNENFAGLMLVSPPLKGTTEKTYSHEEKIYLTLLGEILGYFYENVKRIIYVEAQSQLWHERESLQKKYNVFLDDLEVCQSLNKALQSCKTFLSAAIQNGAYTLLSASVDGKTFAALFTHGLQSQTEGRLRFSETETWINESRSYSGWSKYQNFADDKNLLAALEYENLESPAAQGNTSISEMYVLPIYHLGFLKGLFLLFGAQNALEHDALHYIQACINHFMWFRESLSLSYGGDSLESILQKSLHDPLFSLRAAYNRFESQFQVALEPYSLVTIRFSNFARLKNLAGSQHLEDIEKLLKNYFADKLNENDFFAQIFSHQYLILLKNYNSKKAYRFSEGLEKLLRDTYNEKERPLLQMRTISRLDNEFIPFEELFL